MTDPDRSPVAYVRRAHGIKGDIVVRGLSADAADRLHAGRDVETDAGSAYRILSSKPHGTDHLIHLDGVDDRTKAETLVGAQFTIDHSDRRSLDRDEWWVDDIVGCRVLDVDGRELGVVVGVAVGSSQDRLVMETASGTTAEIPLVDELVPAVDVDDGRIVTDLPPGLLEL